MSDNSVFYQLVTGKCKLNLPNGTYLCRNVFGTPEPSQRFQQRSYVECQQYAFVSDWKSQAEGSDSALPSPVFGAPVRKNLDKEIVYRVITRTGFQMPISNQSYAILQSDKGSFILEVCNFGKTAKAER